MSTAADDKDIALSVCASCGKEGDEVNNICNKCKVTTYCNAVCKKVHKKKHKKECEEYLRLAAEKRNEELRRAAELYDEKLFKPPPQYEDCPICFVRLPTLETGRRYQSCCGKMICSGCIHAPVYDNQGNEVDNQKCAFCRTRYPKSNEEMIERLTKRVDMKDPIAIHNQGYYYSEGLNGYPQDYAKALELWHLAAKLGHTRAYSCIGTAYLHGRGGVVVDKKKAIHYYELAAIGGNAGARNNLGLEEEEADNMDRAVKHFIIAIRGGDINSLDEIKELYSNGHATKDDYTKALKAYQSYLVEIKSDQRDKAAAFHEDYRYY